MELFFGCVAAGLLASLVTILELDRVFFTPRQVAEKRKLYLWWFGFVFVNGLLSAGLYAAIGDLGGFKDQVGSWLLRAILVGVSYLAIIRLKIATVEIKNTDYSVGFEALYEGLKEFFFKRINDIVVRARHKETTEKANSHSLAELAQEAKGLVTLNNLIDNRRKKSLSNWIKKVAQDAASSEDERKLTLANFILSGQSDDSESG